VRTEFRPIRHYRTLVALLLILLWVAPGRATDSTVDDTLLMFVGETAPQVTVASRSPESPLTAPALVTLVTREEIDRRGYRTLAELLAAQPGFFMVNAGRGTLPYLRGLRDAVLFLYDGVPLTTDVSKTFAPLDEEMSLHGIERVEIIYGPGSVLWGPDAFAGVVNIVPRRATAGQGGGELRLAGGNHDLKGASIGLAATGEVLRTAVDLSHSRHTTDHDHYTTASGNATIADSTDYQLGATLDYGDSLQLTLRGSDFNRRYTQTDSEASLRWRGEKETPVNLAKLAYNKVIGASHYALSGYYQQVDYRVQDADIERRQRNHVSHLELLWDRRLLGKALLTLGASWRENRVRDAVLRDGFLPDFLKPQEPLFKPAIDQANYSNNLLSGFGQLRFQWHDTHFWLGARYDDHSQYRSTCSYSLGFTRPLSSQLNLKVSYGTAWRSPYSRQLFDNEAIEPEGISTASLQLEWSNGSGSRLQASLFHSRVTDHRSEDPYGGLSLSQNFTMYGVELAGQFAFKPTLNLYAGAGLHHTSVSHIAFHALRFVYVRPDGTRQEVYDDWSEPADQGPRWQAHAGLQWRPWPRVSLDLVGHAADKIAYSYAKDSRRGHYHQPVTCDVTLRLAQLPGDSSLRLHVRNLFDSRRAQPDLYGPTQSPARSIELQWNYPW